MEELLKVIKVWIAVENKRIKRQKDGTWSEGRYYGSLDYLYKFKLLLEEKQCKHKKVINVAHGYVCEKCGLYLAPK